MFGVNLVEKWESKHQSIRALSAESVFYFHKQVQNL